LERKIEIWSLDPNERAVLALRERLALGERAKQGCSQTLPFDDAHFDAVIMSEVLEHLDGTAREQSLAEVKRVLKAGGRLIGTVPARERLEDSHVVCPNCEHHFHRWGHQAAFDLQSMNSTLSRYLKVERLEERFFNEWDSAPWQRRIGGLIKKFLSWRGLGTYGTARNIFFVARKSG
jgi:ubiquinone/menaquinone biosynthesis C-methylase UbiE